MEIRNSAEALKAFLGVTTSASTHGQQVRNSDNVAMQTAFAGDQATLSHAGTEVSQGAAQGDIRAGKIAAIQQALAAGTYSVAASAVASKVMDAMLGADIESGH
jgi:flagellar biosynthesis anti-sigma factor FlgM